MPWDGVIAGERIENRQLYAKDSFLRALMEFDSPEILNGL